MPISSNNPACIRPHEGNDEPATCTERHVGKQVLVRVNDRDQVVRSLVRTIHANGAVGITAFVESHPGFPRSIGGSRIITLKSESANSDVRERMVANATEEVTKLAAGMASKAPAAGIPASGQKTVVLWPDAPDDAASKAGLLAAHYREVLREEPGAIFGPDMNVGEEVQDLLADRPSLLDHLTGLSVGRGLGIDTMGYTGRALVSALDAWPGAKLCQTIGVQGFGAVGAWAARELLEQAPWRRVVAISNQLGTAHCVGGLPVDRFFEAWKTASSAEAADVAIRDLARSASGIDWQDNPNHIWTIPIDLLVPAARTSVLRANDESCERDNAYPVEQWAEESGVKAVLQGANAPLTRRAEDWLSAHGVALFPDFIVNSGGLWGCWLEWAWRDALDSRRINAQELDQRARCVIARSIKRNISEVLACSGSSRDAANQLKARSLHAVASLWERLTAEGVHERAREHAEQFAS